MQTVGAMPSDETVTVSSTAVRITTTVPRTATRFQAGQRVELLNLSNPNNRDYSSTGKVMAFDVIGDAFDTNDSSARVMPDLLNPSNECMQLTEKSGMKVRAIDVEHNDATNTWSLSGTTWDQVISSRYKQVLADPALGDTEIWRSPTSPVGGSTRCTST